LAVPQAAQVTEGTKALLTDTNLVEFKSETARALPSLDVTEAAVQMRQDERSWWLRIPLVLTDPRRVFAALRDDSDEAAEARQEPITAVVFLAGCGGVLATTLAERLMDDPEFDAVVLFVWTVLAGAVHGLAGYLVIGFLAYLGSSFAGGLGTYRRARHIVGYAAVPLVLMLPLAFVRAGIYGEDAFKRGGADEGATASAVLDAVEAGLFLWALVLVVVAVRVVHGWTWARSASGSSLVAAAVALALARAYGVL
jgi:hypothetical protein